MGLPGALVYRALNTMDAMIGYHGEFEHVGKRRRAPTTSPTSSPPTGVLLVVLAATRGRSAAAWTALRRQHGLSSSPNKLWTIAPMAGALGVRLEKPGGDAVGPDTRPLLAAVIGEAVTLVWAAGAIAIVAAAGLAALLAGGLT